MRHAAAFPFLGLLGAAAACVAESTPHAPPLLAVRPLEVGAGQPVPPAPGETRLRRLRQVTFGGRHSAPRWSAAGDRLLVRVAPPAAAESSAAAPTSPSSLPAPAPPASEQPLGQLAVVDLRDGSVTALELGAADIRDGSFLQGDRGVAYAAATPAGDLALLAAGLNGSGAAPLAISTAGGHGVAVCPITGRLVFHSARSGDIEVYAMEPDGTELVQLTARPGPDLGATFAADGTALALSCGRSGGGGAEIALMRRDGTELREVTDYGATSVAPCFHPDGRQLVFASDVADPGAFDLYLIDRDGRHRERITWHPAYDGEPAFSPDGRHLTFCSSRSATAPGATDIFVAEWVE